MYPRNPIVNLADLYNTNTNMGRKLIGHLPGCPDSVFAFVRKRMRRFGENESGDMRNIVVETPARYIMKEKKAKVGNNQVS